MKRYLITYDLNAPGQDYKALYEKIKSYGKWSHYLDSVWIIASSRSISSISDELVNLIDDNDHLLVIEVKDSYAGWMPKKFWTWMKNLT